MLRTPSMFLTDDTMKEYGITKVIPSMINQNIVENHFSRQRSKTPHPNVMEYRKNNAMLLRTAEYTKTSSKSNYSKSTAEQLNMPLVRRPVDRNVKDVPSVRELANEYKNINSKLASTAKNINLWLQKKISAYVWEEDQSMRDTLEYCAGYIVANLETSFDGAQDEVEYIQQLATQRSASSLRKPEPEFVAFCTSTVIALMPYLQVDVIFNLKTEIFKVAVASIRESQFVIKSWKTNVLNKLFLRMMMTMQQKRYLIVLHSNG